jgi:hypothetical protein
MWRDFGEPRLPKSRAGGNCESFWGTRPLRKRYQLHFLRIRGGKGAVSPYPLREFPKDSPHSSRRCPYPLREFPKNSPRQSHIHSGKST